MDDLFFAVEEMNGPHISAEMHRLCASVVQVVHVLRVTSSQQTAPMLRKFDERQIRWTNRLLTDVPDLPADAFWPASLNLKDGGLKLLATRVVSVPVCVGSKADTAHAVAHLPGQPSIDDMTAVLSSLLSAIYAEHDVIPTFNLILTSLL